MFAKQIDHFWNDQFGIAGHEDAGKSLQIAFSSNLEDDMRVMILERPTGEMRAVLALEIADLLGAKARQQWTMAGLHQALADNGIMLHGADYLFYCPQNELERLKSSPAPTGVRQLTEADAELFDSFEKGASEQDLEDASVALDHWAAFGAFEEGRLVTVGSMYPWMDGALADLGVLTLRSARGKGYAKGVVQAMASHAMAHGFQPQYRCQLDNTASFALARSTGFALYGKWTAESPDAYDTGCPTSGS